MSPRDPRTAFLSAPARVARLVLAAALLTLALAPASATAYLQPDGEPVTDPLVTSWLETARASWREAPDCPGGVRVDRAQRLPDPLVWAAAELDGCHLSLDPDFYPAPAHLLVSAESRLHWMRQMCNVVVHEWGHLLGHLHVDDPRHVMSPVAPMVVPGCEPGRRPPPANPKSADRATSAPRPRARQQSQRQARPSRGSRAGKPAWRSDSRR